MGGNTINLLFAGSFLIAAFLLAVYKYRQVFGLRKEKEKVLVGLIVVFLLIHVVILAKVLTLSSEERAMFLFPDYEKQKSIWIKEDVERDIIRVKLTALYSIVGEETKDILLLPISSNLDGCTYLELVNLSPKELELVKQYAKPPELLAGCPNTTYLIGDKLYLLHPRQKVNISDAMEICKLINETDIVNCSFREAELRKVLEKKYETRNYGGDFAISFAVDMYPIIVEIFMAFALAIILTRPLFAIVFPAYIFAVLYISFFVVFMTAMYLLTILSI